MCKGVGSGKILGWVCGSGYGCTNRTGWAPRHHLHKYRTTIIKELLGPSWPLSQEACLERGLTTTSEPSVGCLDVGKPGRMHFWGWSRCAGWECLDDRLHCRLCLVFVE